ncbi:MAG: hypothetical protein CMJ64_22705 [Planctomycetaceae bacterium]|nr:hypothetical protein [Planctomycetaceae bacterium]
MTRSGTWKWLAWMLVFLGLVVLFTALLATRLNLGVGDEFVIYRLIGLRRRASALLGAGTCLCGCGMWLAVHRHQIWAFLTSRCPPPRILLRRLAVLFAKISFSVSIFLLAAFILLKVYDGFLGTFGSSSLPGLDIDSQETTIRTLELHPYTGWHAQSKFTHQGPMPWEREPDRNYEIRTGQMGFFLDFDLFDPPEKEDGEYRIILIGGSGAQGWGAQSNDKMLYRQLERRLNRITKESGPRVQVINMAMGASITYQNYIALNRWGHRLEPDLILSYSGRNDFVVPLHHEHLPDTHYFFTGLNALVYASRGSEYGAKLQWMARLFPNIMNKTNVGLSLKILAEHSHFYARAHRGYRGSRGLPPAEIVWSGRGAGYSVKEVSSKGGELRRMLDEEVSEFYAHALKSIKRDFEGIPIMLAWQAMAPEELASYESLGDDFYNQMFENAKRELSDFVNEQWYFVNVHQRFAADPKPYIATHLSDQGHDVVARLLADEIMVQVLRPTQIELQTLESVDDPDAR